jgi:hypothetical protein
MESRDGEFEDQELARAAATLADRPEAPPGLYDRLRYVAELLKELPAGARRPLLAFRAGANGGVRCLPVGGGVIVGREMPGLDDLGDVRLSRQHFRIFVEEGEERLLDLASSNHTYVNGRETRERVLRDGDVIEAGAQVLVFLRGEEEIPGSA